MGLDMYLDADIYIGAKHDHRKVSGKIEIEIEGLLVPLGIEDVESITKNIGYWRKANAIHNWFLENCTCSEEGQEASVSIDDLENLAVACEKVLAYRTLAEDILPTSSGFFFGCTDYDDYYYETLKDTLDVIDKAKELKDTLPLSAYLTFKYTASW